MSESIIGLPLPRVAGAKRLPAGRTPLGIEAARRMPAALAEAPVEAMPPEAFDTPPFPFFRGSDRSRFPGMLDTGFLFTGSNRADFYRYLRDRLPLVSAGVWAWVHLCAMSLERRITGPKYAVKEAARILERMEMRLEPYPGRRACDRLTEALFLELFTLGRCAARWA